MKAIKDKIIDLSSGRKTILLVESDSSCKAIADPIGWSAALLPLLQHLRSQLLSFECILYTSRSFEEIIAFYDHHRRMKSSGLFEFIDVVITKQANRFADASRRHILDGKEVFKALQN